MSKVDPARWYENYDKNMQSGLLGWIFMLSHKLMERGYSDEDKFETVLELGATNTKHLHYVRHQFNRYIVSDIKAWDSLQEVEELRNKGVSIYENVSFEIVDAQDLKELKTDSIDRLIATCLILHLDDPRRALQEWRRVVKKNGGVLTFYVHCEPGALLRFLRFFSTNIKGWLRGNDHLGFVYLEHKSHFLAIKHAVADVFLHDEIRFSSFPFPRFSWNFNIWCIYQIRLLESSAGFEDA